MRVALLSSNAPVHNAIGNQIAEKVRFFQERGAEVRLFVQDARRLHPEVRACCTEGVDASAWAFLQQADLVFVVYAESFELLQYLPRLAGRGPRIVFDYHGVTPAALWPEENREALLTSARKRGYVWCADHALTTSQANRGELLDTTHFPAEHTTTLPLVIDHPQFKPERSERWLQRTLGIDGPILLFVGRVAGNKRVPLLVEALARLQQAHAVIVGDCGDVYAEEAARCKAVAEQLGVASRLHFLGQLDDADLARAYRSADVLVMPSLHEGFCVPVIEAMACGLPVIASRSAALPETIADAGLTFTPNDVDDLIRQLTRVLHRGAGGSPAQSGARRIAVVSFRFGPDIVGGAETSLRMMAQALQDAGHPVEVFTTCTKSESQWRNDLPAGTVTLDGLTVHRFPIDPHDPTRHGDVVRTILDADGRVEPDVERRYLQESIHSTALIEALRQRGDEIDAMITGPYLFGLTADVAAEFAGKTLVATCFHDEAIARLAIWPTLFSNVAGILFHSAEERKLAQQRLGVNHPNSCEIGTFLRLFASPPAALPRSRGEERGYVVYCGRYSEQKNLPLLLDWVRRYQAERPGRIDLICMGQGEVKLPNEPWLHDLGRVDEPTKRAVLAGAKALIQLSTQESLSLVALEAWAERTPVIVHRDCAALAGQIARSGGGIAIADYDAFAAALDDLCSNAVAWQDRGNAGRAYVEAHYASTDDYVARLIDAIDRLRMPIAAQMRARGLQRAREFSRDAWQQRFAEFVERVLTQPARPYRESLRVEPLRECCRASANTRTLLLPVRLGNDGTHAAVPGCAVVCSEVLEAETDRVVVDRAESSLPALLLPGQTQVAALPIALPSELGSYRLRLWMENRGNVSRAVEMPLHVEEKMTNPSAASEFLETVQETLPRTQRLQQLPADYVDVTEGKFAPVKRFIKRKLLHNFKHAYVDVLSRQQSQVNSQVVLMIQHLAECCALLDHAVAGLHERLDGLETKMEQALGLQVSSDLSAVEPQP